MAHWYSDEVEGKKSWKGFGLHGADSEGTGSVRLSKGEWSCFGLRRTRGKDVESASRNPTKYHRCPPTRPFGRSWVLKNLLATILRSSTRRYWLAAVGKRLVLDYTARRPNKLTTMTSSTDSGRCCNGFTCNMSRLYKTTVRSSTLRATVSH